MSKFLDDSGDLQIPEVPKLKKGTHGYNLGLLITEFFKLREQREALAEQDKELVRKQEEIEYRIIGVMEAEDIDKASCPLGSVSLKHKSMPRVTDMFEFVKWVAQDVDQRVGFLQRRLNEGAINEMISQQGMLPPGTDTYIKPVLNKRRSSNG